MVAPPTQSRLAWRHPLAYFGLHSLIGLGLSAATAWLFFALADAFPERGAMSRADVAVTAWLQTHGTERGESIFVGVSWLGSEVLVGVLVLVAITLIVRRSWQRLSLLMVTFGGGVLLGNILELIFHRARPAVGAEFPSDSWSFPSGHAMDSFIGYGLLALWLAHRFPHRRGWILLATSTLVLTIGYARIYLGVHYLSDVLAGYCAGSTWLLVCFTGFRVVDRRRASRNPESPSAAR